MKSVENKQLKQDKTRRKVLMGSIALIILFTAVLLMPIKATNVTLQFQTDGSKNGELLDFTLKTQNKDEFSKKAILYNGIAEIALDPKYYGMDYLQIKPEGPGVVLNSISIYSGIFDTYQDKILKEIILDNEQYSQLEDGTIRINENVLNKMSRCLETGMVLKKYLLFLIVLIYSLYIVHTLKTGIILKYTEIVLWSVLAVVILMVLFGDRFHLPNSFNVGYSTISEGKSLDEVTLNKAVSGNFFSRDKRLKKIHIDFSYDDESVYSDLGVSVIDKENRELVYSHVINAADLERMKSIEVVFKSPIRNSNEKVYQIKIEPLGATNYNTLKVWLQPEGEQELMGVTSYYDSSLLSKMVFAASVLGIAFLLLLVFGYKDFKIPTKALISMVYIGLLCYMILQVFYYAKCIGHTPDESAHISYVQYLLENKKLIPNFANMHMYKLQDGVYLEQNSTNYLGHPPLYYWMLTIIQMIFGRTQVNVNLLRMTSAALGVLAVGICFYLGYTRIKRRIPYIHLLYAMGIISVPFVTYGFSGVNNDTLSFLGVAIAFWGILRFEEKKRNMVSYLLLSIGMLFVVFSKLTAGIVLGLAYIIYIIYICIHEKSINSVFNRSCIVVIPFIIVIASYFLFIYYKYGGFQPSLEHLNPSEYAASNFYVPFGNRTVYSVKDYIQHYWTLFFSSWSEISSHISISKSSKWFGLDRIIYIILLISPAFLFKIKNKIKGGEFCTSIFIGICFAIIMQFFNAFQRFYYASGYPGGFQSRYYLCWVPILAYSFAGIFGYIECKKEVNSVAIRICRVSAVISVILMGYGGFIYTLLVGRN
ncbi:glycosyltransferase family 39 protein [Faecalicatena sp. AGMB00832]|uniref:Glycosyltransferase family 39 protein n=1 Tax=Faecalicatena faecalis TaxID=2726362 RepID=A0ABS6CZZ1_9FIRM|nr:glycosyltransferase family 39 protein [Faecalicatena faecalis]MBU3874731.1 glycosyltransferase family 39 protein [Faecalicatena faecalis]